MGKKIYAVRKGIKTGIFESWDECLDATKGFSGAEYKSFTVKEDAEAYLRNENIAELHLKKAQEESLKTDKLIAYIDGSYEKNSSRYSFGCIIITPLGERIKDNGYSDDPEAASLNNVAGELLGALYVTKWSIKNGYKDLEIRHDYEGIAKWASGEWKAKNRITTIYKEEMEKLQGKINISFTKVDAHTNNPLNDEVDKLAKEALTQGKRAKISTGDTWFTAEGIASDEIVTIVKLVIEEIPSVLLQEKDIPYGKRYELSLNKEKLIIQHYPGKNSLQIQGKFQQLFTVFVAYISQLVEVEEIPEFFNNFFKLEVSKDNVKTEFMTLLPNAAGKLPEKLNTYLHQAVYNLNIHGDMFDATFLAEPALRAMDGHLKNVLLNNGISLHETAEDKQDKYFMFVKDGSKYKLSEQSARDLSEILVGYIGKCYTYFHNNRHQLCHWDDPTAAVDTTRLTRNVHDAHTIIKNALSLINEYYVII